MIAPPLAGNVIGSGGANCVVAEWRDAGGPPGPPRWIAPLHLHRSDDEAPGLCERCLRSMTPSCLAARTRHSAFFPLFIPFRIDEPFQH